MAGDNRQQWEEAGEEYRKLIESPDRDSVYLREKGLIPTVKEFVGSAEDLTILDAGCGPGWLESELPGGVLYPCDVDRNVAANTHPNFSVQDIRELTFDDMFFDVVVANFVLMWIPEIQKACREFHRVTRPGGRLIVSLVHPYFYRTGVTQEDGTYLITRELSRSGPIKDHKIAGVVGPFDFFYHRLDDYLNALARAGWAIRQVKDWYIDIEDYRANNRGVHAEIARTGHVPLYVFIECVRDSRP